MYIFDLSKINKKAFAIIQTDVHVKFLNSQLLY